MTKMAIKPTLKFIWTFILVRKANRSPRFICVIDVI